MKLKAFSPLLDGFERKAVLTTNHAASSYGRPVLVLLDNGDALGPGDCALADYRVTKATEDELRALDAAGYRLPIEGAGR